jgi:hypothetical protein
MNKAKILNYLLSVVLLVLIIKLAYKEKPENKIIVNSIQTDSVSENNVISVETSHQARVWLTVSESKRLIAKGLKNYPPIQEKLKNGYLLITKGTTNTYVAEEFLNDNLIAGEYVLGHILPADGRAELDRSKNRKEVIFKNGVVQDSSYQKILKEMKEGDIVLKGANIINYKKGQAGVLIGHPTGGTTGNIVPAIKENKLRLIIPVGLEKESSQDINLLSGLSKIPQEQVQKKAPYVWSIEGELFTEIEAIKQFASIEAIHMASGGIGGAEGAVTLLLRGNKDEVLKAIKVVEEIQGEKAFLE